jgi:formylglycine-generating enzyme
MKYYMILIFINFALLFGLASIAPAQNDCEGAFAFSEIFSIDNTGSIEVPELVKVPSGTFTMGDVQNTGHDNEKPVHQVMISSFYIGRFEVTNALFAQFVEAGGYNNKEYWLVDDGSVSNPEIGWTLKTAGGWDKPLFWDMQQEPYWKYDVYSNGAATPVIGISWYEAWAFCKWISSVTGESYRLPTEAEWEYAARGGESGQDYPYGNQITKDQANFSGIGGMDQWFYTAPVGSFPANAFGIHDMNGNVWEWVSDWFSATYYGETPAANPKGPQIGTERVVRGGSFNDSPANIRNSFRIWDFPDSKTDFSGGFRVVCDI